ncbi:MAG TPA: bifunctional (p)ppGpp synthetase/guanosine-3',5'-bis(diphosphate) 3'-pyrophosphohydrolase [Clostridiales bacterium]|nr:bifunctional (p)ppGpp synthetase/guanosine-3',5'-bis(diphosphate) 3'-pyrophosphohydrolase [Clostridiales bacterium]
MSEEKTYNGFETLRKKLPDQYDANEVALIEKAYAMASKAHAGQTRFSGEPYIMHPVEVTEILFELGMDYESLIAAMLHDVVEDTDITLQDIEAAFGKDVANLVDGVTKLGKVPIATWEERQAENIRKMLIAMSQDIRVIIIKLADRLHNMRTLEYMRPQKQMDKALETLEIYAPIAHRLGINSIKEQLEDIAIRYLDPFGYESIQALLKEEEESHPDLINTTLDRISERIHQTFPKAEIYGRRKSIYGIYRKMFLQEKEFNEIYDIYACRIIVDTVADCYNCLGIIHDMFHSLPGRFKDYISTPKSNMYQSLHTTVISEGGIPFEVQIRTREMHQTAEYGIAAHWKYKLGDKSGSSHFEEQISWIRQLLETQKDSDDVEEIVKTIKNDFVPDDVFVFTPKGDVINIPAGSTVIDFAYAIHTQVGHRMIGAKVDGRIVPLDYQVKTGEIVEVLRSPDPNKGPSRDWLKIVKTSGARTKIRSWFKKERREENIEEGRIELEKTIRRNRMHFSEEEYADLLKRMTEKKSFEQVDDFYAAIGYGSITMDSIMPFIREEYSRIVKANKELPGAVPQEVVTEKHRGGSEGVIVDGIDNCLVKLSRCCNPLPGDEIIGFITRGHGVSVHKKDCTNVPQNLEEAKEPDRWISVHWAENVKEKFNATINIFCLDKIGLLADISTDLASMHVYIQRISSMPAKGGNILLTITVTVNGADHLNTVIRHLRKLDSVIDVERTGI